MNKLVKGSIAGAAGIALLLGGAGTLAYWNSTATFTGGDISTGELSITAGTSAAEYLDGTALTATSLIVPGDTVIVTQVVNIEAAGDNLDVQLTVNTAGLATIPGVNFNVDVMAGAAEFAGDLNLMTPAEAESITSVVVTGTFPTSVTGTQGQNLAIDLSALSVSVTQLP